MLGPLRQGPGYALVESGCPRVCGWGWLYLGCTRASGCALVEPVVPGPLVEPVVPGPLVEPVVPGPLVVPVVPGPLAVPVVPRPLMEPG